MAERAALEAVPKMAGSTISQPVEEVIFRLPVCSIVRWRSVTKGFKHHIDEPGFANRHLKYALDDNFNLKDSLKCSSNLFVIVGKQSESGTSFYTFSVASISSESPFPKHVKNPIKSPGLVTIVIGSCHGLLLLSNNTCTNTIPYDFSPFTNPNSDVSLWNPSIGYHKLITLNEGVNWSCLGIGYDILHQDYKIVRIGETGDYKCEGRSEIVSFKESRIEILSLKENNWRVIGSFLHAPRGRGVYLNGKLHWTAYHTPRTCQRPSDFLLRPPVVVVVDLGTENIQFLQAPPNTELGSKVFLKVLGGNLCAIVFHPQGRITETWVMKEYGVEASWEKRMTLKATRDALYGCKTPLMMPLAYSENKDDILVDDCGERFIWSIETEGQLRRDARIIKTPDETESVFPITGCEVYMGSLVTPRREEGLAFEGVQIEAVEDLNH